MTRFKSVLSVLAVVTAGVFQTSEALALSPPWFILQAQTKATLEADPCVYVDQLKEVGEGYELNIHEVCNNATKAQALADLLSKVRDFGGTEVKIQVLDSRCTVMMPQPISPNSIGAANTLTAALTGNRFFIQIDPGNMVYAFFVEFTKCVVQYYGDNLADAYGNINQVAADAFLEVLGLPALPQIQIGTTTSPTQGCR